MFQLALRVLGADRGFLGAGARPVGRRRRRGRCAPVAERLEVRDCPSGASGSLGISESLHAIVAARHAERDRAHEGGALRRAKQQAATIYVAPNGKAGASAGQSAAHPASLAAALKRAKAGATLVLAAGTYTQAAGMTGKSDLTIEGAAGGASVLAGSGAYALKVYSSSGITIENVSFRSPDGSGLAVVGSSVDLADVQTTGTHGDGVVVGGGGSVNATSSHFDSSQTGDGMDVQDGSVTINGCTFNGNGTAGGSALGSGLSVEGSSSANLTNSQFIGNTNSDLVAYGQAQVTAQGSTFSDSRQGDGAIFSGSATVSLAGNTFASNGTVVGYASGFNGVEFDAFTGTAVVSGNTFSGNTANGLFIGGASQTLQITGNTFASNLVGLNMDATDAPINAIIQGNTFTTTLGSGDQGLVAAGSGVTATVGGSGSAGNTFENFADQRFILEYNSSRGATIGGPDLTLLANTYLSGGNPVSPSQAILTCC